MTKIKSLFLLTLLTFLFGCKTKEVACDSYSEVEFIQIDTFCIESQHVHIEEENLCIYFEDMEIITIDTIYIPVPVLKDETYNYASN